MVAISISFLNSRTSMSPDRLLITFGLSEMIKSRASSKFTGSASYVNIKSKVTLD